MTFPSVTQWITQLKAGDPTAAQKLWEGYFLKMVEQARRKLQGSPRRMADEEDVALSAFNSFCRGASRGRFPLLDDRNSLWALLLAITAHKATDQIRREHRQKRGGRKRESDKLHDPEWEPHEIIGREPTAEFSLQVAEECQRLLDLLGDESLRCVALWRMESYTVEEIADRLDCVPRTVERKLRVIRRLWEDEIDHA